MQVLFIRHATAQETHKAGDARRKLTKKGIDEAKMLAEALEAMGLAVDVLLTSPLDRAVQTAAIVGEMLDVQPREALFLAAEDGHAQIRAQLDELARQGVKSVAMVGHSPISEEMIGELIAGNPHVGLSISKAGAAMVQTAEGSQDAELMWLLRRKQIELMQP
ncbi:MAG: phosphohistidine phosphatase SixA [Phycisphaerae bacterium]